MASNKDVELKTESLKQTKNHGLLEGEEFRDCLIHSLHFAERNFNLIKTSEQDYIGIPDIFPSSA